MPQKVFRMYLDYSVQYVPGPDHGIEVATMTTRHARMRAPQKQKAVDVAGDEGAQCSVRIRPQGGIKPAGLPTRSPRPPQA